jgi:hypothetical protein
LIVDGAHEGFDDVQSFHPILDEVMSELAASAKDSDLRCPGLREATDGSLVLEKEPLFGYG